MAEFLDALADAELFLLGVSVQRTERAQLCSVANKPLQTANHEGTQRAFYTEDYRIALG